jgi:flagellar hook-associated protein 3 FlgL
MRVSTKSLFDLGANAIRNRQGDIAKLQQQLATGRRVLTPSDDPIAASRTLIVSQAKSMTDQFAATQDAAKTNLTQAESVLASVTDLLSEAKAAAVNAGNGSLGDGDRKSLAVDLRGKFDQLLALANSRDSAGAYLFAGYKETAPPFAGAVGTTVTYSGDNNQRELQVSASRTIPVNFDGSQVFEAGANGAFGALDGLIQALERPISTAADHAQFNADVSAGLGNIDRALDKALTVRTQAGAWQRELDSLGALNEDQATSYASELSQLQDLDYAQAISQFSQQMTVLEAAQKSYAQSTKLSLFNFI